MSKVYTNKELLWVVQAKSLLEANGIACFLRNEYASSIAGKVPFNETWPELWVHDSNQVEKAAALLQQWVTEINESEDKQPNYTSWKCDHCGEINEGNFSLCWSCGQVLETADGTS